MIIAIVLIGLVGLALDQLIGALAAKLSFRE
jgi:ABC-type nitrate/sulfonate/bicarbonate transport system permease component